MFFLIEVFTATFYYALFTLSIPGQSCRLLCKLQSWVFYTRANWNKALLDSHPEIDAGDEKDLDPDDEEI